RMSCTPVFLSSAATVLMHVSAAAFIAAYALIPSMYKFIMHEVTEIILPCSLARNIGRKCFADKNCVVALRSISIYCERFQARVVFLKYQHYEKDVLFNSPHSLD